MTPPLLTRHASARLRHRLMFAAVAGQDDGMPDAGAPCPVCHGTGEVVRSRVAFVEDDWLVTRPCGAGVCPCCGGSGRTR